jgi:hypothetical protein
VSGIRRARFVITSAMLMLASLSVWIRGHYHFESIRRDSPRHLWLMTNRPRGIYLASGENFANPPVHANFAFHSTPMPASEKVALSDFRKWYGIDYGHFQATAVDRPNSKIMVSFVLVPHWLPTALCAMLMLLAFRRLEKQRKRAQQGMCRECGYDLRATPDRCPEGGAIPLGSPLCSQAITSS